MNKQDAEKIKESVKDFDERGLELLYGGLFQELQKFIEKHPEKKGEIAKKLKHLLESVREE